MAAVVAIGEGYYTIDTKGVTVNSEVDRRIEEAFREASSIRSEDLNIHFINESSSGVGRKKEK